MTTQAQDFFRPWNSVKKTVDDNEDNEVTKKIENNEKFENKLGSHTESEECDDSESDDSSSDGSSTSYNSIDSEVSTSSHNHRSSPEINNLHEQPTTDIITNTPGLSRFEVPKTTTTASAFSIPPAFIGPLPHWDIIGGVRPEDAYFTDGNLFAEFNRINQQEFVARQIKKTRPKNFSCHYCTAAFSNNGQLKGHLRTHTGEKPFRCNAEGCSRAFTRNEELTRHKRIHTGLKPYVCEYCHKKFGRKDHLKKHLKTHSRYPSAADYAYNAADVAYMTSLIANQYYGYYPPVVSPAYGYPFES